MTKIKMFLLFFILFIIGISADYFIPKTAVYKIVGADTKTGESFIYTSKGAFKNEDAWFYFKFNSWDIQAKAKAKIGNTVKIKTYGWRIPVLSMCKNVVSINKSK